MPREAGVWPSGGAKPSRAHLTHTQWSLDCMFIICWPAPHFALYILDNWMYRFTVCLLAEFILLEVEVVNLTMENKGGIISSGLSNEFGLSKIFFCEYV